VIVLLVAAGGFLLALTTAALLGPLVSQRGSLGLAGLAVFAFVLEVDAEPLFGGTVDRARDVSAAVLLVAIAGWALLCRVEARRRAFSSPVLWLGGLFALGASTAVWSVDPLSSVAKSVSALALLVVAVAVVDRDGADAALGAVLFGLAALVVGSLAWEVVGPGSRSLLEEGMSLDSGLFGLSRHGGLAGDSNHLGRVAAVVLGGGALVWSPSSRWPSLWLQLVGVMGLGLAQSRTALIGGVLAAGYIHLRRGRVLVAGVATWLLVAGALAGWATGSLSVDDVTREGSTRELTTLTGRTDVWAAALEVAAERPFLGHGAFAADVALETPVEDGRVPFDAADAHNLLLNIYLTQGLVGVALLLATVAAVVARRGEGDWGRTATLLLVLLTSLSLTENLIRSPNGVLLLFAVSLAALTPASDPESGSESGGAAAGAGGGLAGAGVSPVARD
jgi:O-antigen ligase